MTSHMATQRARVLPVREPECHPGLFASSGMTAIELLVATSLAALLMVAVMGILARMSRTRVYLLEAAPPRAWRVQCEALLQHDFANSKLLEIGSAGFALEGYAGADLATGEPSHRRSRIEYVIVGGDKTWWLRRERHLDAQPGYDGRCDLLSPDIASLDLQVYAPGRRRWESLALSTDRLKRVDVPALCRVIAYKKENKNPAIDVVLVRDGSVE